MNAWMLLLILGAIIGYLQIAYWSVWLGCWSYRRMKQRKYREDKRRGRIYLSKV